MRKLNETDVAERMTSIEGWTLDGARLRKEFLFGDFVQAFGFMTSVALVAEAMNHHPEWSNVYNRVVVHLSSHEVGGISELDFELAIKIESIGASFDNSAS